IVSGIGHETDFTIADMVADARAPTPTAAAEMLSPDQQEWLAQFARFEARLLTGMQGRLRSHQQHLDWFGARLVHPRNRIALLQQSLRALAQRLYLAETASLRQARSELQAMTARLQQHSPRPRLQALALNYRHLYSRLAIGMRRRLELADSQLRQLMQTLHTLSPLATLERGYAVVQRPDSGAIVTDARKVKPGERVQARLARGQLDCLVEKSRGD
ncbi:MAG: exodeoxyribonuclease VII large subunit, partial [Gammaproteobacteria bacterium]|nr:exodeoxyribonuclease VII large subunit [Gammaproteobacteria bacterium]